MTNYEKLAGTPQYFAELLIKVSDSAFVDGLFKCFCRGPQCFKDDEPDCTDEKLMRCILAWLGEEAT